MAEIRKLNNAEEYQEFVNTPNSLNVCKIGAPWCSPCRVLESTLHGLSQEEVEGVLLAEVNADEEWFEDLSAELKIRGIPVMIAFKGGNEVGRIVGVATRDKLIEFFGRNK